MVRNCKYSQWVIIIALLLIHLTGPIYANTIFSRESGNSIGKDSEESESNEHDDGDNGGTNPDNGERDSGEDTGKHKHIRTTGILLAVLVLLVGVLTWICFCCGFCCFRKRNKNVPQQTQAPVTTTTTTTSSVASPDVEKAAEALNLYENKPRRESSPPAYPGVVVGNDDGGSDYESPPPPYYGFAVTETDEKGT